MTISRVIACSVAIAMFTNLGSTVVAQSQSTPAPAKTRLTAPITVLHLYRHGIDPAKLSVADGETYFVIDNKSGAPNIFMRIDRVGGAKALDLATRATKLTSGQLITLQPGEYVVTEANHPTWQAKLTVTGK